MQDLVELRLEKKIVRSNLIFVTKLIGEEAVGPPEECQLRENLILMKWFISKNSTHQFQYVLRFG